MKMLQAFGCIEVSRNSLANRIRDCYRSYIIGLQAMWTTSYPKQYLTTAKTERFSKVF